VVCKNNTICNEKKDKKKTKGKRKNKTIGKQLTILLILLMLILFSYSTASFEHPLSSTSFIKGNANLSIFRFNIKNIHDSPTLPFRLWLSANLSWFKPKIFNYLLPPDGYNENASPYWDIPPIFPNESIEISFMVNERVGMPEKINVTTETIHRWDSNCSSLIPINNTYNFTFPKDTTVYYSKNINTSKAFLVYLEDYDVFAVFIVPPKSDIYLVSSDEKIIKSVVSSYVNFTSSQIKKSNINTKLIESAILDGKKSKQSSETDCLALTGMNKYPCVDRESCRYACMSVTVCSYVAQGWNFIDTLYSYNQTKSSVNSKIDVSLNKASIFSSTPSYNNALSLFEQLIELNRAETALMNHPIFTSYGFCSTPDFSLSLQIKAKNQLLDYMDTYCIYKEEGRIVNESLIAAAKLSSVITPKNMNKPVVYLSNTSIEANQSNTNNSTSEVEDTAGNHEIHWEFLVLFLGIIVMVILILIKMDRHPH
jgi:hypothetical protein